MKRRKWDIAKFAMCISGLCNSRYDHLADVIVKLNCECTAAYCHKAIARIEVVRLHRCPSCGEPDQPPGMTLLKIR